jgi:carbonic anhydrase/acetyltransferase-like protein (isoleucine patch superfamily)
VIRSDAVVEGSVVGPGAVVGDRAKVTGLTMIGDGMVVEAGAALDGVKFPESG